MSLSAVIPRTPLTHEQYDALARCQGLRLPNNQEVSQFLRGAPVASRNGADTWVPTIRLDGKADWVQVGDGRHGQSHLDVYGPPGWQARWPVRMLGQYRYPTSWQALSYSIP